MIPDAVDETLRNVTAGNEIGRYTSALKEEEVEEEKKKEEKSVEGTRPLLARDVDAKHYADGRWTAAVSRLSNEAA